MTVPQHFTSRELLERLVAFPTVSDATNLDCIDFIADYLTGHGVEFEIVPQEDGRNANIFAIIGPKADGGIMLSGHLDVVPVEGQPWTTDPFTLVQKGDRLYGRGACDMKGGLAASIVAAEAFMEVFPGFSGAIEISGTVDEESGGFGGVAYLARQGYFSKPRVDHVIIPEPLNKDRICLGHRGVWWAEIETKGSIAHGSMPFLGDSAIRHMGAVLDAFEQELFPALDRKQTNMPVVPEGARRSTLNLNSVHGGQTEDFFPGLPAPNVADSCRLVLDRRFLIEEPVDEVKREVTDILDRLKRERPRFDYRIRDLMEVLPLMTEADAPVPTALAHAIRLVLGREPQYICSPGTYDQKHVSRIGHLHDCVAYGPGILDLAHRPDEWVGIVDMVESAKIMAMALDALLRGGANR